MRLSPSLPLVNLRRGFSLIEVALSLGIVGFACVSLIALLSIGLSSSRANIDRNVVTQIAGTMKGAVRSAIFADASAPLEGGHTVHYNDYGVALTATVAHPSFAVALSASSILLPGGTTPIKRWKVAVTSPVRDDKALETSVFWSAP